MNVLAIGRYSSRRRLSRDFDRHIPAEKAVFSHGFAIWHVEREQAPRIVTGETLRAQTSFDEYLTRRADDFSYLFRQHRRQIGVASRNDYAARP